MDTEIRHLIKVYKRSAENLRKVADLAEERDPEQAHCSRSNATVYDIVVRDLELVLAGKDVV